MNSYDSYLEFVRPEWAPPAELFGPVWTVLYVLITISFGFVFYKAYVGEIKRRLALPFALNLVFNLAFTPIQFGLQNNFLASIDILLVLATLIWALSLAWNLPRLRWVALINLPYLAWVSFATVLQLTITYLNWS